jgi:hypothetical protein
MRSSIIALAVATGITASPAFAANLITNGDFTNVTNGLGQITTDGGQGLNTNITSAVGWITSGYNMVLSVADQSVNTQYGTGNLGLWDNANAGNGWNGKAPTGNMLALDGDYYTSPVSQTISGMTAGQKYTVNFNYAFAQQSGFYGATVQSLTVNIGNGDIWHTFATVTTPDYNLPSQGFSGWAKDSLTFTAASSTQVLSFLGHGNLPVPPFALVSNVSMVAVPNPEAGAGLFMLAVFGGLAFTRRFSARGKAAATA